MGLQMYALRKQILQIMLGTPYCVCIKFDSIRFFARHHGLTLRRLIFSLYCKYTQLVRIMGYYKSQDRVEHYLLCTIIVTKATSSYPG
jgi:hypothetical protein